MTVAHISSFDHGTYILFKHHPPRKRNLHGKGPDRDDLNRPSDKQTVMFEGPSYGSCLAPSIYVFI